MGSVHVLFHPAVALVAGTDLYSDVLRPTAIGGGAAARLDSERLDSIETLRSYKSAKTLDPVLDSSDRGKGRTSGISFRLRLRNALPTAPRYLSQTVGHP